MAGVDERAGAQVIKCTVPLANMFGYVTQLRTMSSGRATSTMEFDHFEEVPRGLSEDILTKLKGTSK